MILYAPCHYMHAAAEKLHVVSMFWDVTHNTLHMFQHIPSALHSRPQQTSKTLLLLHLNANFQLNPYAAGG